MKEIFDYLKRPYDAETYDRLKDFVALLHSESQKFNLTGWNSEHEIWRRGVLDSVYWTALIGHGPEGRCVDIGAGAGFPGIPLKCFFPEIHLTLVESIGKKARFLETACTRLFSGGFEVCNLRAEDLAHSSPHRRTCDRAFTRALAGLSTLHEISLPFLKIGGLAVHLKGTDVYSEIRPAQKALETLGGRYRAFYSYDLPGTRADTMPDGEPDGLAAAPSQPRASEGEVCVLVEKVAATPPRFPRKAGAPFKHPL